MANAISIMAGYEGHNDPDINFDLNALSEPDNLNPNYNPAQMALPGIEPEYIANPQSALKNDMIDDLRNSLTEAFNKEAENKSSDVEPPDYLAESAKEQSESEWDQMDDEQKYGWGKNEGMIDTEESANANPTALEMPGTFDPLNNTSGADYRRTQALAKYIADRRAAQVITDRTDAGTIGQKRDTPAVISAKAVLRNQANENPGNVESAKKIIADFEKSPTGGWKPRSEFLGDDASYEKLYGPGGVGAKKDAAWTARMVSEVQSVDARLWSDWKASSTSEGGKLIQVAAAEELGGRLREAPSSKGTGPFDGGTVEEGLVKAQFIVADKGDNYLPGAKEAAQKYINDNQSPSLFGGAKTTADSIKFAKGVLAPSNPVPPTPEEITKAAKFLQDMGVSGAKFIGAPILKNESVGTVGRASDKFIRLTDINLQRSGAASTTTSLDVANGWGGTTNNAPGGIVKKDVIDYANKNFAAIGGYEGVKAVIRAKWETTQYLLDRADMPVVPVYRGLKIEHTLEGAVPYESEFNPPFSGVVKLKSGDEANLWESPVGTSIKIASGKTITKTSATGGANLGATSIPGGDKLNTGKWTWSEATPEVQSRIVMRAEVPRTAIMSVPAYGINVESEQEAVVLGTAYKNWDAWSGRAPSLDPTRPGYIPIGKTADPVAEKSAAIAVLSDANKAADVEETAELDDLVASLKAKKGWVPMKDDPMIGK